MKNIKKIAIRCLAVSMIGVTLLGAAACGIKQDQYDALNNTAVEQAKLIDEQAASILAAEENSKLILEQKEALALELENKTLILNEKDQEIIAMAEEVAAEVEAETTEAALQQEEYDGLVLGEEVAQKSFDTYDLSFLNKNEIEFNDDDYDFREYIELDGLKVGIAYSDDVDFEDNSYLLFNQKKAVKYVYKFEDAIDYTEITEKEPLEINFLGNDIEIVDMDADEFTYKIAEEHDMLVSESVVFDGHNVTLIGVSENGDDVLVDVDGIMQAIDKGESEDFDGLEVFNKKAFAGKNIQSAKLEFGADVLQTIEDGDEYIKDNEDFVWNFEVDGDNLKSLSVVYDVKANDIDEEVLAVGDALNFVDYFDVVYDLEEDYDYVTYSISFDEVTDADIPVMAFETDNDDIRVGDEKLKVAYFDGINSYYKDGSDWVISAEVIKLENDDMVFEVGYDGNYVTFGDFFLATADFVSLGVAEEAEDGDVIFDAKNLGKVDESIMLPAGLIIESVEDNAEEDEVVIQIPNEEVKSVIRVIQK